MITLIVIAVIELCAAAALTAWRTRTIRTGGTLHNDLFWRFVWGLLVASAVGCIVIAVVQP